MIIDALVNHFYSHKADRYNHLSEYRYQRLVDLVRNYSDCLVIDDVFPITIKGFEFDIELQSGASPVRQQLPKMSPQPLEKQKYHIAKEEQVGHLRVLTDKQKSEWATRTHIVNEKDDPMGRWICDFKPLNRLTKKRPTAICDVFSKTLAVASKM